MRSKTLLALLIIATVTLGRVALEHAGTVLSAVPVLKDVGEYQSRGAPRHHLAIEVHDDAARLIDKIGEAIGPDVSSIGNTLDALTGATILDMLLVLAGTQFALYVVCRPFMPAFRLKRLLFNLSDDLSARRYTTARWHVQQATGLYEQERAVFVRLGDTAPREPPVDLIVPALLWASLPVALGIYLLANARHTLDPFWKLFGDTDYFVISGVPFDFGGVPFDFPIWVASLLLVSAGLRLAWLLRAWRRRQRRSAWPTPYNIALSNGRQLTLRDPWIVGVLVFLVPLYLPLWWYVVNRQLLRRGKSERGTPYGRLPVLSGLAVLGLARSFVLPTIVSLWRGHARLRTAERDAGIERRTTVRATRDSAGVLLAGLIAAQLPIANLSVVAGDFRWLLSPLIDSRFVLFNPPWSSAPSVAVSAAVLAFVAGAFQRRLNASLRAGRELVPEGPGARPSLSSTLFDSAEADLEPTRV